MAQNAKRSPSPLPQHFDNITKVRLTERKKHKSQVPQPEAFPETSESLGSLILPQRGQEVLSLSPSLPRSSAHENINDLILEITARLAREGKRLIRAPQLLPEGIAFDWTYDITAQGESLKTLLSVQGISAEDLDKVLSRRTPRVSRASTLEPTRNTTGLNTESRPSASVPPLTHTVTGDVLNPIVIDDDDREIPNNDSQTLAATTHGTPRDAGPSCPPMSHRHSPCQHSGSSEVQDDMEQDVAYISLTVAADRASVVTYASSPRSVEAEELRHDGHSFQPANASQSQNTQDRDEVSHLRNRPNSTRNPIRPSKRQLEKGRADYGNWQSLAAESSDSEMNDERTSSKESSPDRAFPAQSPGHVPGLSFLPQTYDVSNLATHQASASTTRSGSNSAGSDSEPFLGKEDHPSPDGYYSNSATNTGQYRRREHTERLLSDPDRGPPNRPAMRKNAARHVQSGRNSSDRSYDARMDVDTADHGIAQERPLERPHAPLRGRVRTRRSVPSSTTHVKRTANSHHTNSTALRSRSSSIANVDSDLEGGGRERAGCMGPAGHTVVIPKAEYARGRRLLAPGNQDLPLATVLMRGDAHFIDQRRKTRITSWSLPAGDDSRHVEDACLIGSSTVVIGYNKGPCQVSLIPVLEDQVRDAFAHDWVGHINC
ncbi:hypothetical protein BD413DRAFT_46832 [Trametes elegans]|nr:hypothetical protein BD413DRAFT_46832 [Trametes elegans]